MLITAGASRARAQTKDAGFTAPPLRCRTGATKGPSTQLATKSGWTLDLPKAFRRIENEDSLQADDGKRTIYFSAMSIVQPKTKKPLPAKQLHDAVPRAEGKTWELADGACLGHARLKNVDELFQLETTREADGTVLTCVITYSDPKDHDWALDVWRSIRAGVASPSR